MENISGPEWFLTNSLKAGEVLRKLHHREDDKRVDFIGYLEAFIKDDPDEDGYHGLFEGRIPQVLIDIAAERHLYKQIATDDDVAVST